MNEYWIVKDRRTGRDVAHCGNINDAIMLVGFDPDHRTYYRKKLIMDQIITVSVEFDKQLHSNDPIKTTYTPQLDFHKQSLPHGEGKPINISL